MRDHANGGRWILCGNRGVLGDLCHQFGMNKCQYMEDYGSKPWEYSEEVARRMIKERMCDEDADEETEGDDGIRDGIAKE